MVVLFVMNCWIMMIVMCSICFYNIHYSILLQISQCIRFDCVAIFAISFRLLQASPRGSCALAQKSQRRSRRPPLQSEYPAICPMSMPPIASLRYWCWNKINDSPAELNFLLWWSRHQQAFHCIFSLNTVCKAQNLHYVIFLKHCARCPEKIAYFVIPVTNLGIKAQ